MSLDDAYRLTIPDFESIYEQYMFRETARYQTSWEQVRFISHCALVPHVKKGFKLHDVCVFDWEKEDEEKPTANAKCTAEEFERMKKKYGAI